ncbi:MAG: asparagine synthase (glutamine-hydrolyzing) [Eubacteriales bacterium]
MCGIVGWINTDDDISSYNLIISTMMNTLKYRGPDSYGTYLHKNVLLGHRRLAVIDPEGGQQPMTKIVGDKKYTIVYNGELYNTDDIKLELISHGYTFTSYSDTEVLLTAYIHWKYDCVNHLNGIFAFCIWDEFNGTAFLARDHLGVKPLFYTKIGKEFLFASEIKALLAHPYVESAIDEEGLLEIFGLGPATNLGSGVFKNISEIPPAHAMIYKDSHCHLYEYWTLKAYEHQEGYMETLEHTKSLLVDAVHRQLVSDVPLCTFLSGGLDSSFISMIASQNIHDLNTFSVDYKDNDKYFKKSLYQPNSDDYYIQKMVDFMESQHHSILLEHNPLVEALDESVIARDLPGMADVDSSLFLFCKEIKKHATVALSGECADEIFGGYPWYTREEDLNALTFPWAKSVGFRTQILNGSLNTLPLEEYVKTKYEDTLKKVPKLQGESIIEQKQREMFYLNIKWFMLTLLNRKDRMSMRNSLEVRVPFADYRLAEYAFNIPKDYKLIHGREKGLLREALKEFLPEIITNRKKSPYPKTHHPLYTTIVQKKLLELLLDKTSPILDIINKDYVLSLANNSGSNFSVPWYGQLMMGPQVMAYLVQVNFWLKHYKVRIL